MDEVFPAYLVFYLLLLNFQFKFSLFIESLKTFIIINLTHYTSNPT